jgi:hypothetical protein
MTEELDDIATFEAKETSRKLPVGWLILFFGLIAWGIYYFLAYTPAVSGWTQERAYQESVQK